MPAVAPIAAATPADRQHASDRDAAEARRFRILRRGPHRQPGLGEAEEQEQEGEHHQRDAATTSSCVVINVLNNGRSGNGLGKSWTV